MQSSTRWRGNYPMISPSIPSCSLYALPRQAVATVNKRYIDQQIQAQTRPDPCASRASSSNHGWPTSSCKLVPGRAWLPAPPSDAGLTHIDVLEAAPRDRSPRGLSPTAVSRTLFYGRTSPVCWSPSAADDIAPEWSPFLGGAIVRSATGVYRIVIHNYRDVQQIRRKPCGIGSGKLANMERTTTSLERLVPLDLME
jgi:hypothetical protein